MLYNKTIKHYTLLKQNKEKNKASNLEFIIYIDDLIEKNIELRKQFNKKENPICIKSSPNTYNEVFNYLKNGKIPERIIELKNKSLYIQRFKKMKQIIM